MNFIWGNNWSKNGSNYTPQKIKRIVPEENSNGRRFGWEKEYRNQCRLNDWKRERDIQAKRERER